MLGLELHEAAASGDYDTLEELLRSGRVDVNLGDEDWGNKTALHWSCQKGYVECSRLLLDNGAKGTARTSAGYTPAHFAAEAGRVSILRALHAASVAVDRTDNYGSRPSRVAEIYDHQECIRFLKQAEVELAERRDKFELVDLSEDEDDEQVFKDKVEEVEEKKEKEKRTPDEKEKRTAPKERTGSKRKQQISSSNSKHSVES